MKDAMLFLLSRGPAKARRLARAIFRPSPAAQGLGQAAPDDGRRAREQVEKQARLAQRQHRLEAIAAAGEPVVLFLSPEAGLEPFHATQVLLAKTLDEAGRAAIVLSCNGLMPMCTVKFATRTEPGSWNDTDNPVCVSCRASGKRTADDYELLEVSLESLVGADELELIDGIVRRFAETPWMAEYDDVEFGRVSLAEVLRDRRKHAVEELDDGDVRLLIALLRSSLAIYLAIGKFAARFKLHQIAYFGEYAYWQPAQIFAARNGLGLLALSHGYHRDLDRRLISIRPRHAMVHIFEQIEDWPDLAERPIPPGVVTEIAAGALYRLSNQGGASNYSPVWSGDSGRLFEELGLSPNRRTIVAYPSSYDEFVCTAGQFKALGLEYPDCPQPFADQECWLRELVEWVSERSHLQLVLRLHPRMGIGSRHSTLSSDYRKLKEAFSTAPPNVAVVWPESKMSSYSIAEFADVALISWSSIGLELARFGIPVVAAFQRIGPVPRSDFIRFQLEKDRYFAAVEEGLDETAKIEKIVGAFRWTHYLHWSSLIDVSDVIPTPDFPTVPTYRRPREQALMLECLVDRADITRINMDKLDISDEARDRENAAIFKALKTFLAYFDASAHTALGEHHKDVFDHKAKVTTRLVQRLLDLIRAYESSGEGARRERALL